MKTTGHHVCNNQGLIEEIEKQGPFLSVHLEDEEKQHKFLGTGYYFWDNNIGMAHAYGQKIYRRRYYIFESDLVFEDELFLDLVGNRNDMLWFQTLMKRFERFKHTEKWTIGNFIEFLKSKNLLPFNAIRAIDNSVNSKEILQFVATRPNYTNLNPVFIICLLDKNSSVIKSFKHLKTFP
jgi:hypothetical protein